MDGAGQARRRHSHLQRSRLGVLGRDGADLRARLRRGISAGRRRLGPASGAGGEGPSAIGRPHRPIGHPRRVRHHRGQQDGGRSRPHRADESFVRLAEGMAVPGDPARGQCGALSAADRPSLLHARPRHPQGGGILSGGFARRGVRHRRHVAPDFRPARRPDQQQVRQGVPGQPHQGPEEAHAHSASRIYARSRRRRHRDGDVAGDARRARRQGRRGLSLLHRAGVEHRRRPYHSGAASPCREEVRGQSQEARRQDEARRRACENSGPQER